MTEEKLKYLFTSLTCCYSKNLISSYTKKMYILFRLVFDTTQDCRHNCYKYYYEINQLKLTMKLSLVPMLTYALHKSHYSFYIQVPNSKVSE